MFIVAFTLDVVYEVIVYRWVYPGQAFMVDTVLAIIPYLLVREPFARILRRVHAAQGDNNDLGFDSTIIEDQDRC